MKNSALRLVILVTFLATTSPLAFSDQPGEPAERELADDLKLLQGTWEMFHGNPSRPTTRSVKTIEGNKEILRRFNIATGNKTHEHAVEFQLSKSGDVRVMTFYAVGGSPENGLSYVYRIDEDNFWDIPGLLQGTKYRNYQDEPTIWHWRRVAAEKAEAKASEAGCSSQE